MGRPPHHARWRQANLLADTTPPPPVDLPPEICQGAVSALAELLLAHLSAADMEERDEREAES